MVQRAERGRTFLGVGAYAWSAGVLILVAVLIRLALIAQGWPLLDSDEGTMGLMALHIAYRGEYPVFFYGQGYMGAFEAYLAAAMFHLFGVSAFSLRLGLILLYALFLWGMYLLTSLFYSRRLALFTLLLLVLGSNPLLTRQLVAVGGVPETLLVAPFLLLLPCWLALSWEQGRTQRIRRMLAYFAWGLLAGFGLWSHMLVAPFLLFGGLLLLCFCGRELVGWAFVTLTVGFLLFFSLQIVYNLSAPANRKSWVYIFNAVQAGGTPQLPKNVLIPMQIKGALFVSLPTTTGANPLCAVADLHVVDLHSLHGLHCTLVHTGWSFGVILLWLCACLLALLALWQRRGVLRAWRTAQGEVRENLLKQVSRLALLLAGAMPVVLYLFSPNSAFYPVATSRYLIGVLVCTPAILWPLWRAGLLLKALVLRFSGNVALAQRYEWAGGVGGRVVLGLIAGVLLLGTVSTFTGVPAQPPLDSRQDIYFTQNSTQHLDLPLTQDYNRQERLLIDTLLSKGIKHIYSDYWSCDRLIFQSQERLLCSAVRERLEPGHNRYSQYPAIVKADPQAAYVLHEHSVADTTFAQRMAAGQKTYQHYQRFVVSGYAVYRPLAVRH